MTPKDLARYADAVYHATAGLIRLVPEDRWNWKPGEGNWMTAAQLAKHVAEATGSALRGFIGGDWGPPPADGDMMPAAEKMPTCTKQEALDLLEDDRLLMHEMLDNLPDEEFDHKKVAAPWGGEEILWFYCVQMVEHQINHKMQLYLYLKQMGLPVSTKELYGM